MGWQGAWWAALLGLSFGSFAALVLHRMPRKESILWSRSHCDSCGHTLSAYELVPVCSYLLLGGRCKVCRKGIPAWDLLVEVIAGMLTTAAFCLWGWAGTTLVLGLLVAGSLSWGATRRTRPDRSSEAGVTLLETVIAVAILTSALITVMAFYAKSMAAHLQAHAQLVFVNQVKEKLDQLQAPNAPADNFDWTCANGKDVEWRWHVQAWIDPQYAKPPGESHLRKATIEWRRNTCGATTPVAPSPEHVSAIFRK